MRKLAIPALAAAGLALSMAAANAQSVGVEINTGGPAYGYGSYYGYGPGYGGYYGYRSAPERSYYGRSYGYRSAEPTIVEERGIRNSGGCGTYFFWNGDRCVDARNK